MLCRTQRQPTPFVFTTNQQQPTLSLPPRGPTGYPQMRARVCVCVTAAVSITQLARKCRVGLPKQRACQPLWLAGPVSQSNFLNVLSFLRGRPARRAGTVGDTLLLLQVGHHCRSTAFQCLPLSFIQPAIGLLLPPLPLHCLPLNFHCLSVASHCLSHYLSLISHRRSPITAAARTDVHSRTADGSRSP